jgi:hypothetical protein
MQEELDARAQEEMKLAPGNVKLLRTWENLESWERMLIEEEIDEKQRALERLNVYGPEPIDYYDLYLCKPEKFHG